MSNTNFVIITLQNAFDVQCSEVESGPKVFMLTSHEIINRNNRECLARV